MKSRLSALLLLFFCLLAEIQARPNDDYDDFEIIEAADNDAGFESLDINEDGSVDLCLPVRDCPGVMDLIRIYGSGELPPGLSKHQLRRQLRAMACGKLKQ